MADEKKSIGPVAFVVAADADRGAVIFKFSKAINILELGVDEALTIASSIMQLAAVAAGKPLQQLVDEKQAKVDFEKSQRS